MQPAAEDQMWKWLAVGAMAYGLLCMWLVYAAPVDAQWDRNRPGHGRTPSENDFDVQAWPRFEGTSVAAASSIDFEVQPPMPLTVPRGGTEIKADTRGNHFLEWRINPAEAPRIKVLIMPITCPQGSTKLRFGVLTQPAGRLIAGLRQTDGRVYLARDTNIDQQGSCTIALAAFRPVKRPGQKDVNLDPAQVREFILVAMPHRRSQTPAAPFNVALDDIELR